MGTHVAAAAASSTKCLQSSEFVGRFSPQKSNFFGSSLAERKILTAGRRCSGRRHSSARFSPTLGHSSRSGVFCQVQQNSEEESARSLESSCGNEESVCEEQAMKAGKQASNASTVEHLAERSNFRIGRRMLLGAVSVGLSSVYHQASSEKARAADKGFNFSLDKRSWFLGDSEADLAPGDADAEKEKRDSGPGEDSRVYDATALGEPVALGTEKDRVWKRLLENRVVYLGEAEKVADADDKLLELEIVRSLRDKCFEQKRSVSLAFKAFPSPMQPQLNAYMNKDLLDDELRDVVSHLPEEHWQQYLPILQYCKTYGVRLVACGAPLEVLRTVQAKGVQALSKADMQKYIPPAGGGYKFRLSPLDDHGSVDVLPNASDPFGPGPYRFAQARIVEDYAMSQVVTQIIKDGGAAGLLLVIAGASHVQYGTRGSGLPAWIAKNKEMQKRNQAVVLLNPDKQQPRKEGDVPEADFLWYSAAKVCTRNCFDRSEVARVMGAAGRRRDALPKDLQVGLKQGLVAPEVLESFFELEQNPLLAELTSRFQGVRERWLADPRFLQRLAIEESISITTTLIAQYERRGLSFWKELDYVATDTIRGAVVDFFTVWLPAPRLSFREINPNETFNALDSLKGLLGSFPDNAFQRPRAGENWGVGERVGGIVVGGLKLFAVGFISSIGTSVGSNLFLNVRRYFSSQSAAQPPENKRSPLLKTALVYSSFLGTSANLRYQVIAGVVEHWVADYWLVSQPLLGSVLSFVTRVANSYFGTGQWVDLARFTGLQAHSDETKSSSSNINSEGESDVMKTSEPVSPPSLVDNRMIRGLQAHSDETKSSSSNLYSEGESDVAKTSEPVSPPSLVDDRVNSTVRKDQLQETLKLSKGRYPGSPED